MKEPVRLHVFIIRVQVYDTRRRANKVQQAIAEQFENWSIDHGDMVRGMTVEVEPVVLFK